MFKVVEKNELNQISLTGLRAIVILGLLMVAPRTFDEIRNTLLQLKIIEESTSTDILRIDLNTLKKMGCKISRASAKTNYKYILEEHPFSIVLNETDIKVLKKVYKKIKETATLDLLFEFDKFFKKLSKNVFDQESKEGLLGISVLKNYNIDEVNNYIEDCKEHKILHLKYKTTSISEETEKIIIAQKLVFNNDKIYLYGHDTKINASTVLNIKRIKKVISRIFNKENIEAKLLKIKFSLKGFDYDLLGENERVIDKTDIGLIVEGEYYNKFLATQRILSFGAKCTVLESLEFRNYIIEKLKEMRKVYE